MSQSTNGVNDPQRGTAPVWKRALTTSLHAVSGLVKGRYDSTYHRSGAAPVRPAHRSWWSSFTSGVASVGQFIVHAPATALKLARSAASSTFGAVKGAAQVVGHGISGAAGAVWYGLQHAGTAIKSVAAGAWRAVAGLGKAVWSGIKAAAEFVIHSLKTIVSALTRWVESTISEFNHHEASLDRQIAKQDKQANRQWEKQHARKVAVAKVHEQKVYDEQQLARTVETARQAADQHTRPAR